MPDIAPGSGGRIVGPRFNFATFLSLFRREFAGTEMQAAIVASAAGILQKAQSATADQLADYIVEELAELGLEVNRLTILNIINETLSDDPSDDDSDIITDVTEVIDGNIGDVRDVVEEVVGEVEREILDGQASLGDIIGGVIRDTVGGILEGIGELSTRIGDIFGGISEGIGRVTGLIGDILNFLGRRIDVNIANIINIPGDVFEVVIGGVVDAIEEQIRYFENIFGDISDLIRGIFSDQVEALEPPVTEISVAIREQTETEEQADDAMLDEVRLINDDTEEGTGASLAKAIAIIINKGIERAQTKTAEEWYRGFSSDVFLDCREDDLINWIEQKGLIDGTTGAIVYEVMQVVGKAMGLLTIGSALGSKELYEFSRCTPWEILEPGDAVVAYQRQLITHDQVTNELKMRGYNDARVETLIETGYQVPDLAALYSLNLRGLAPGADLTGRIRDLGYSPSDAEGLEALKYYIPPPADLISMAVRDVFNPTRVQEFAQDEDFPEEFEYWAGQQGISSDWAHKYWQAHWVLPSVQMAFEMLHRDVIDEDQLRDLMAAQDIIPGWREALIAISYRPFTRVDIRRMNAVGVLDEQQVFRAYKDIGYDDDKAATLTAFTLELNKDDDEDIEPYEGLTRSSVIAAFKDGIIDRVGADELLKLEGVGEDAREIYLIDAELDRDRRLRKDAVDTIMVEFENGVTNSREAQVELGRTSLTALEREEAELKLRRIAAKKVKLPTRANLDKMYKNGIIDQEEYEDQLERIGYPERWIRRFRHLIEMGIAPDEQPV